MIKKLISTILCMITLCHMGNFYSCAFSWPWAEAENKCVNPKDVKIAYDSCLNDLKEGKGFCSQLKVGPKCGTDLWFWDYVQIKKALSNLKKCSLNTGSTIDEENIIKVADTIKALFKTDPEMSKEISKHWLSESIIIKKISKIKLQTKKNNLAGAGGWFGAGVGGLVGIAGAGAFIPGVGQVLLAGQAIISVACIAKGIFNTYMVAQNNTDSTKLYSMAFDKILAGIMNENWKKGDIVSLRTNSKPGKDCGEHVDFIKLGIHYDENTKEEYENMFSKLKEELIDIVEGKCC